MIPFNHKEKTPSYKEYKNRTVDKNISKLNDQLICIRSNSLKPEDKKTLIIKMQELINDFKL